MKKKENYTWKYAKNPGNIIEFCHYGKMGTLHKPLDFLVWDILRDLTNPLVTYIYLFLFIASANMQHRTYNLLVTYIYLFLFIASANMQPSFSRRSYLQLPPFTGVPERTQVELLAYPRVNSGIVMFMGQTGTDQRMSDFLLITLDNGIVKAVVNLGKELNAVKSIGFFGGEGLIFFM